MYIYPIRITKNYPGEYNLFAQGKWSNLCDATIRKIMEIRYHCTRFVKMLESEVGPKLASVKR